MRNPSVLERKGRMGKPTTERLRNWELMPPLEIQQETENNMEIISEKRKTHINHISSPFSYFHE